MSGEQVEDLLVVELNERDSDERLNGIPDPQVVEDVVESSRDDPEFAVLQTNKERKTSIKEGSAEVVLALLPQQLWVRFSAFPKQKFILMLKR